MKKKIFMFMAMFIFSMVFTSCATLMRGGESSGQVKITATVPNAKVYVNEVYRGTAPMVLDLDGTESYLVKVKAPGYSPYIVPVKKTLSGWFWGNILIGGPIGMVVDVMTGKAFKMKDVNAVMQ